MEAPGGTGTRIKLPGYELAGKTGTAQRFSVESGRYGDGNNSNFVGMVPAHDPQAVIVVMVEKAKVQQYGGMVAGPAFKKIAEAVVKRYRIPPTRPAP
jgi:cell division protein FtsI/penicillin-binding protein 2